MHGRGPSWIGSGPWLARARLLIAALAVAACGAPATNDASRDVGQSEPVGQSEQAIYGGVKDDDAQASAAVVALRIGDSSQSFELCSGALIAPNVVLTARHCVSKNLVDTIGCDAKGASSNGDQVGMDELAASIHVFTGASPNVRTGTADADAKAIFHPASTVLCNTDIALILLDRPLIGITPLSVRLTGAVSAGETLRAVGFGENDEAYPVGTRLRRDGVTVLAVGPTPASSAIALASREFEVGQSICQGDSGGPAISAETGAIVGVVSRGGDCTVNAGHIYTATGPFADLFTQAFAVAGGAPLAEVLPAHADAGSPDAGGATSGRAAEGTVDGGATPPLNLRAGANAGACAARVSARGATGGGPAALLGVAVAMVFVARRRRRS